MENRCLETFKKVFQDTKRETRSGTLRPPVKTHYSLGFKSEMNGVEDISAGNFAVRERAQTKTQPLGSALL